MDNTVRKNITLDHDTYIDFVNFAKSKGMSFSGFLRTAALNYIDKERDKSLVDYLNEHCPYASAEEEKEILSLNIDFDKLPQEEIDIDELLKN